MMKTQLFFLGCFRFIRRPAFFAFVYFVVLTFIMTYPLVTHMNEIIGGMGGDGTTAVWGIAWYQKALFDLKISPLFNPNLNFPQGFNLATGENNFAMLALAMPGAVLFSPTWGYNFALLISFVLSGWGMYLWIKSLTKNDWAGLVGGTIFAFLPFRMAHVIVGHLGLAGTQWFPFYFLGLYDLLRQDKFSWKPVIMACISAVLIALTSLYYIYMTIIVSVIFILGFLVFGGYKQFRKVAFWKSTIAFGILSIIFVGLSVIPFLNVNSVGGMATRPVEYVSSYSASPTDFFLPSVWHFLWGNWVINTFHPGSAQEATLYIGAVTFVLAVIAWAMRRRLSHPEIVWISLAVATAAFILALGIEPYWLGEKIVTLPRFLQPIFHRADMPQIYLPSYYLYRYLPFFSKMRVMMRFGLFTLIFLSLMAGLGAHALLHSQSTNRKRWVTVVLIILIFIDFYPGVFRNLSPLNGRPVDYWLATQPNTGAVAQFPFSEESSQNQLYYTLVYQKPFLGGYFTSGLPEQYARIQPTMDGFPSKESVILLKQLGVSYVVVDSSLYADYSVNDQAIRALGLQLLKISQSEYVYSLP
jgi:hypothetical protein